MGRKLMFGWVKKAFAFRTVLEVRLFWGYDRRWVKDIGIGPNRFAWFPLA